jgi:hypothetical protein
MLRLRVRVSTLVTINYLASCCHLILYHPPGIPFVSAVVVSGERFPYWQWFRRGSHAVGSLWPATDAFRLIQYAEMQLCLVLAN